MADIQINDLTGGTVADSLQFMADTAAGAATVKMTLAAMAEVNHRTERAATDVDGADELPLQITGGGAVRKVTVDALRSRFVPTSVSPGVAYNYIMNTEFNQWDNDAQNQYVFGGTSSQFNAANDLTGHVYESLGQGGPAQNHIWIFGYDNAADGLASVIIGQHHGVFYPSTHGTLVGSSYNKILSGDYSTGIGGAGSGAGTIVDTGDGITFLGGGNSHLQGERATMMGSRFVWLPFTLVSEAMAASIASENAKIEGLASGAICNSGNRYNTTSTQNEASGTMTVTVADPSNFAIGLVVAMELERQGWWFANITNVSGSVITFDQATPDSLQSGDLVYAIDPTIVDGTNSVALGGRYHSNTGVYSVTTGDSPDCRIRGIKVHGAQPMSEQGSSTVIGVRGDSQSMDYVQRKQITNDATTNTDLAINGNSGYGRWNVYPDGTMGGRVIVMATDVATGDAALFEIPFAMNWTEGGGGTLQHGDDSADTVTHFDNIGLGYVPRMNTNTAADLRVRCRGHATKTIRFVARYASVMTLH